MTDHICEWAFNTKRKGDNWFCCKECGRVIHAGEIERRLNATEKLKPALEKAFAVYPYENESGIKKITLQDFAVIQGIRQDAGWRDKDDPLNEYADILEEGK